MGLLQIGNTSVNIDGHELGIEDVDSGLAMTNGCVYDSVTASDGKRMYNLQKDPFIKFEKDEQRKIVLTVIDVPGGKNKESIEKLRGYLADTTGKGDHSGYAKPVTIGFLNAAEEVALCMKFLGCVSEIENIPADRVKAAQYKVTLLILDMETLNFDK